MLTFLPAGSRRGVGARVLLLVAVAATASAHDTWIGPVAKPVSPGSLILLELSSGDGFPFLESSIDPTRVTRAEVRLGGKRVAMKIAGQGEKSLRFSAELGQPGVATIAVVLRPNRVELTPSQVKEYLAEIGVIATAGPIWDAMPEPKKWRETYAKSAKTCVRVGNPLADSSWSEPVGCPIDIVPQNDPTLLSVGDSLRVVVLKKGDPLPGFSLAAEPGPAGKALRVTTDSQGGATVAFATAGPWLLNGTDLRFRAATQDWESDFTTLTVHVASRPIRPQDHAPRPPEN